LSAAPADFERVTYRKVTGRLIPFLFLCYVLAYLDRVNVGFAKLQMQHDLGLSEVVYGIGAGIFFIGYFLFEVPSNLLLQRLGARFWIARIMIVWGLVSTAMVFTRGPVSFYALRFVLGLAEAGFFPGVILYLTFWYTRAHRARMVAAFMTAIALSGLVGGPVSGWILGRLDGLGGYRGWQWLFLLEGLPSVLVGVLVFFRLDDGPRAARWLSEPERALLLERLAEEERLKKASGEERHSFGDAFRSGRVWLLSAVYFGVIMGLYGISFWLPQILEDTLTRDPWKIGLLSAIPWGTAALVMVLAGHHSDKTGERRWHVAAPALAGALGLAASSLPGLDGITGLVALTLATCGVMAAIACFWSLPTAILSGTAAAAGIAWINSVGNLAGYASPFLVGVIRDTTGATGPALFALAASLLLAGLLVLGVAPPPRSPA
jgi:D-galactonate transporter